MTSKAAPATRTYGREPPSSPAAVGEPGKTKSRSPFVTAIQAKLAGFRGESSGDEKLRRWFPTENKPNKALFLSVSSYVRRLPTKSPSPIWRSVSTISTLTAPEPKPPPSVVFFHYGSDARAGSGRRRFRRLTVLLCSTICVAHQLSSPINPLKSDPADFFRSRN
ncbi:hypothetical protein MRB53_033044 [Persea americana]|uniref:Uncharacterized protein n=1 Tax=Persea americana TaxID=3435 RepID=A0ACC2KTK3_PERAE|nr:hypothetical protein MRB53_033044 [Persea americana]